MKQKPFLTTKHKQGFTIVELVIVIAVIGILAAVLGPAFGDVIQKANQAKDIQTVKNMNTALSLYSATISDKPAGKALIQDIDDVMAALAQAGFDTAEELTPVCKDHSFYWYKTTNQIVYVNEQASAFKLVYPKDIPAFPSDQTAAAAICISISDKTASDPEPQPETDWRDASAVFVGDSITHGTGTNKIYHAYLKETLHLGAVTNMGIAGSCISVKSDYGTRNTPLVNRYQNIPKNQDLIVLFMGTNDYGHETPLGSESDVGDVSFYGALNTVLPAVKSAHPNSQLVVMTPLHRYGFGTSKITGAAFTYDHIPNGRGHTLADYVNAIKTVCQKNDIAVIDLFNLFPLDPTDAQVRTEYMPDGLHPNAAGHEVLARIIAAELKKIPRKESSSTPDTPEVPDMTPNHALRIGNRFGGASFDTAVNRICTVNNLYLKAGTIITVKENNKYDWAVSKETNAVSTTQSGYCFSTGWDSAGYRIIAEDGWYGFTLKKTNPNDSDFDLGGTDFDDLLDYFVIAETVELQSGNRFVAGHATADRLSATFDLYLPANATVTLKPGTEAARFGIYRIENGTCTLLGGGWLVEPFTVSNAGYYGLVLKTENGDFSDGTHFLFDYLDITGYPNN